MKQRHSLDDGVGKIEDDVHRADNWDIHRIQPRGIGK